MRTILCAVAAVLFFLAAIGSTRLLDRPELWGFFCLALGLALEGYKFSLSK